jgi:hypothetical protein
MQGNGDNQVNVALRQEFLTTLRHESPKRFPKRHFPAIFELLNDLPQWMFSAIVSRIAAPSSGTGKIERANQADTAKMVVSARVQERAATNVAQGMAGKPDLGSTDVAKVFTVPPVDSGAAGTTTWRIKPIHQPI